MIALTRTPMFGFAVLAFLFLCAILAFAVWFATRGAADPSRTRISGPAGCAIGCALLAIAGLGAIATAFVLIVNLPGEFARHGPIERLALRYGDADDADHLVPPPDAPRRLSDGSAKTHVHAEIELRPGFEVGPILRVLRREISSGLDLSVSTVERDGESRSVITIDVPLDAQARRELHELLQDLKSDSPDADVPEGIVLEIRGPND
jgi:hypothetical protein